MSWFPVYLSLKVAFLATFFAFLVGLPAAWLLARWKGPLGDLAGSLVLLPMVLPPSVVGFYLLLVIGRQAPLGRLLERWGVELAFTPRAAVLASTLVALPLVIRAAQAGFEAIDRDLEDAARTFGASEWAVFRLVTVPLAGRALLAGGILAFARAMGEFGATLIVGGNIPGRTQTLSIAIFSAWQAGNDALANSLALLMSVLTVVALLLVGRLARGAGW